MPFNIDWTSDLRRTAAVEEYVLLGHAERGLVGKPWETWGIASPEELPEGVETKPEEAEAALPRPSPNSDSHGNAFEAAATPCAPPVAPHRSRPGDCEAQGTHLGKGETDRVLAGWSGSSPLRAATTAETQSSAQVPAYLGDANASAAAVARPIDSTGGDRARGEGPPDQEGGLSQCPYRTAGFRRLGSLADLRASQACRFDSVETLVTPPFISTSSVVIFRRAETQI
eukprot:GHVT01094562.1.p1 GENE.GHVT01094562.1~~GHVT01094562.1.p1  ORF type:complete len:228 (+),score=47.65 GHVT01094562.1:696-1379(+)